MTENTTFFDDTREALSFALNFEGHVPAPMMTRMMSQVRATKKFSKVARKRILAEFKGASEALLRFLEELFEAERLVRRGRSWNPPTPRNLDGAHLAGWILSHFARLSEHQQTILAGRTIVAYQRCSCGSPCCSGWRRDPRWAKAVRDTCTHLEEAGDVAREGKRGLSTRPEMRLALVEQYYTRNQVSLTQMAQLGECSLVTAAKHRDWINSYLEQEEDSAWTDLALIFDAAGITGAFS